MAEPRFTPPLDLDGLSAEEAFGILGNEVRIDIVRTLWEAGAVHEYDDVTDTARTIPYSTLRQRVDVDDNGRLNYHLSRLRPHFVRRTDDGYRLSGEGRRIARTVISVAGPTRVDLGDDLDRACPLCGADLAAAYDDGWLRVRCPECDGLFGDRAPDGAIFYASYPAGAVGDRPAGEAVRTGFYRCMLDIAATVRDVCPACWGPIASSVDTCRDHGTTDGGECGACGSRFPVWVEHRCDGCGFAKRLPVEPFVLVLPPVMGALAEADIDVLAPTFEEMLELLAERVETEVTSDSRRIVVTVDAERSSLAVTLDRELNPLEVERTPTARSPDISTPLEKGRSPNR